MKSGCVDGHLGRCSVLLDTDYKRSQDARRGRVAMAHPAPTLPYRPEGQIVGVSAREAIEGPNRPLLSKGHIARISARGELRLQVVIDGSLHVVLDRSLQVVIEGSCKW